MRKWIFLLVIFLFPLTLNAEPINLSLNFNSSINDKEIKEVAAYKKRRVRRRRPNVKSSYRKKIKTKKSYNRRPRTKNSYNKKSRTKRFHNKKPRFKKIQKKTTRYKRINRYKNPVYKTRNNYKRYNRKVFRKRGFYIDTKLSGSLINDISLKSNKIESLNNMIPIIDNTLQMKASSGYAVSLGFYANKNLRFDYEYAFNNFRISKIINNKGGSNPTLAKSLDNSRVLISANVDPSNIEAKIESNGFVNALMMNVFLEKGIYDGIYAGIGGGVIAINLDKKNSIVPAAQFMCGYSFKNSNYALYTGYKFFTALMPASYKKDITNTIDNSIHTLKMEYEYSHHSVEAGIRVFF